MISIEDELVTLKASLVEKNKELIKMKELLEVSQSKSRELEEALVTLQNEVRQMAMSLTEARSVAKAAVRVGVARGAERVVAIEEELKEVKACLLKAKEELNLLKNN